MDGIKEHNLVDPGPEHPPAAPGLQGLRGSHPPPLNTDEARPTEHADLAHTQINTAWLNLLLLDTPA